MAYAAPEPDEISAPFWAGINSRVLRLQFCMHCARWQYPPAAACRRCASATDLGWWSVSGRGHVRDCIVMYDTRVGAKQEDLPFNLAVITLDEAPYLKFWSNLPGVAPGDARLGAPVELIFVEAIGGQLVHEWKMLA